MEVQSQAAAQATIVITETVPAPTAVNDAYTVNQGAVLTVNAPGVLLNDTIPTE